MCTSHKLGTPLGEGHPFLYGRLPAHSLRASGRKNITLPTQPTACALRPPCLPVCMRVHVCACVPCLHTLHVDRHTNTRMHFPLHLEARRCRARRTDSRVRRARCGVVTQPRGGVASSSFVVSELEANHGTCLKKLLWIQASTIQRQNLVYKTWVPYPLLRLNCTYIYIYM